VKCCFKYKVGLVFIGDCVYFPFIFLLHNRNYVRILYYYIIRNNNINSEKHWTNPQSQPIILQ
jgi:hypothetical protein